MSRQRGANLLNVGEKKEVFISAFEVDKQENAIRFWGQFDAEAMQRLEILMEDAQRHAENDVPPPSGSLSTGDVCLAKFMDDGQWYRARVESVTGNDVIAYFIDYGNTEIIPRFRVRTVAKMKRIFDLPPQATNCKLANVEPVLDSSSLKAGTHEYLREKLEYMTFRAEVIARIGGNLEVKLCNEAGNDIAQKIIHDGYGRAATGAASPSTFRMSGLDVRDRVFISNVNTPNQFWVQQEKLTKDLEDLMSDMFTHYSESASGASARKRFSRGNPCVTTFSDDGNYYRAVITNTMGSNNYEVFFVDYGNSDIKPGDELLEMHPKFLLLPSVAIESCLSDVDPDSCSSDEAAARFEELVSEKVICCKVTRNIADKCSLMMIDPTGGENADIASVLVKEGLAGRPSQDTSSIPHSKPSPPQGYSARNIPARGDAAAGGSSARELDFNLPKYKKPQVRVGDKLDVQVTFVKNGAEFVCHMMKDADKFDPMMENLGQVYTNISPGDQGIRQVAGGLPCCVQFSEDNAWYRAEVTYVRGQDVEVRYVDYGNSETVTPAQLKNLKPQFFSLPVQSILCTLDGIPHSKASKSTEVKDFMDSTVAELDLIATIVWEQKGMYSVKLVDRASGDNINSMVGSMLEDSSPRGSPRAEMLKEYKTQTLREGEKLKVFIGHVDDQAKCYVQKSATVGELEALMETMSQQFASFGQTIQRLSIGMSCGAQYSADEAWYRAKVTGIRNNGNVEVTFVDYGNSEMVNSEQIKMLSPDMLELPAQAIPCILDGLPAGQQTSEEVAKLQEYIESECTLEVKGKDRVSGVYTIRLSSDGKCINDQFRRPDQRKHVQNDLGARPKSSNDGFGSDRRLHPERERFGSNAKSPPQQKENFGQNERRKGGRFHSDGSGDAPDSGRFLKPRGDRASVSSNISGRSSRSDDSRGKGSGRRSDTSSSSSREPAVPLQFKEVTFPSRGTLDVFVSHINSPNEFWCQTAESTPQLQRVMSELSARYSSLHANDKKLANTAVGTPCVAKFSEDECWYRAVVVNKHIRKIEVMFVDYGNSEKVAIGNLKEIVPELVKLPVLAVKCSLPGDREWHSGQTDLMKEAANQAEPFKCDVKSADCGVYEVELSWKGKRMTQELEKVKPPAPVQSEPPAPAQRGPLAPVQRDPPAPMQREAPAPMQRETPAVTTAAVPSRQVSQAVETTIQVAPVLVNIPFETESMRLNKMEDVVISYWEGPSKFWCQLAEKIPKLDAVMEELGTAESLMKVDAASIKEEGVCCAKYAEDEAWYRARITKVIPDGSLEVFFMDYGNKATVKNEDLRALPENLTSFPAQAMECNLLGLTTAQALAAPAVEKFTELISEKQLIARAVQNDLSGLTVTLLDTNTAEDIDIAEEILKVVKDVIVPFSYPLPEVTPSEKSAFVTNVDAGKIYLQLASCTEQLDIITSLLQSLYDSCSSTDYQLNNVVPGQACCVNFSEDDQWYRGMVTATTDSTASVLFIDYGNCEVKPIADLKQPTEELLKTPHLALECRLDGASSILWSQEVVDHFLNITADKELLCTFSSTSYPFYISLKHGVVDINAEIRKLIGAPAMYPPPKINHGRDHEGYIVNVDPARGKVYIQLSSASEHLDMIADILAATYGTHGDEHQLEEPKVNQACCAKYVDGLWYRGIITGISGSNASVFYVDYGNSEEKPLTALKTPPPELLKIPQIVLECSLGGAPQAPWTQDAADHLINVSAEKAVTFSFTIPRCPFVVLLNDKELIATMNSLAKGVGSEASVETVTYSPAEGASGEQVGYVVNVDPTTGKVFIQLASVTEQLDTVTSLLESTYSSCSGSDRQLQQVSIGQACCAKFTEDEQWYRGIITSTNESTARVLFIDYGNYEDKLIAELKTPELLTIPRLAIECSLDGVPQAPWTQDAADHLVSVSADKELTCTFSTTKSPYVVQLKDGDLDLNADMLNQVRATGSQVPVTSYPAAQVDSGEQAGYVINVDATTGKVYVQLASASEQLDTVTSLLESTYSSCSKSENQLLQHLVGQACCTKFTEDEQWYRGTITAVTSSTANVFFIDYGNSEEKQFEDLKSPTSDLLGLPQVAIECRLTGVAEVPWPQVAVDYLLEVTGEKELNCSFDTTKNPVNVLLKDGETDINAEIIELVGQKPTDCPQQSEGFKSLCATLQEQKRAEVYVTATTSPSEFWIQPLSGEEALATLMDELNTYAESPETETLGSPAVGAPCVAKYTSDEGWYRGIISSVENDSATVRFVDYGNSDAVSLTDLKLITPELMALEAQAVCGTLSGVGPAEGASQWNGAASEYFETAVSEKLLLMEVLASCSDTLEVKLMDMGMNIGEKMIDEGHAIATCEKERQFPSVTSVASTASESGEALDLASADLVEKVLSASLQELELDESEDATDLAEADMASGSSPVADERETETIAHLVIENLLEELTGNASSSLICQQVDQKESCSDPEQTGETEELEDDGVEEDRRVEARENADELKPEDDVFEETINDESEKGLPEEQSLKAEEDIREEQATNECAASNEVQKDVNETSEGTRAHQNSEDNLQGEATAKDVDVAEEMPEGDAPEDEAMEDQSGNGIQTGGVAATEETVEDALDDASEDVTKGDAIPKVESELKQEVATKDTTEEAIAGALRDAPEDESPGDVIPEAGAELVNGAAPKDVTEEAEDKVDDAPEDEMPDDSLPKDIVPEGGSVDSTEAMTKEAVEDVPEADAAVQDLESKSEDAFQSDEECFKDAVATEADQHKELEEDAVAVQDGEEEEEDDELGFSDAVQEMENNTVNTQEQSAEPEADQSETASVGFKDGELKDEENGEGDEGEDGGVKGDEAEDSGVNGEESTLPEGDVALGTEDSNEKGRENIADESQGDLRIEFAAMNLNDSKDVASDVEIGAVADGNDAAMGGDVECVAPGDTREMSDDVATDDKVVIDGSGDAHSKRVGKDAGSVHVGMDGEADADESFETARVDISNITNITSPGEGDCSSLYASITTLSGGSADLDSTLEGDKTLDLSESTESGTGSGKGFGEANGGGGGDAAAFSPPTLSPPRCDSGIMEDREGSEVSGEVCKKQVVAMEEAQVNKGDGAIPNGTD